MTQEQKQLLLTEFCVRLPYGITIYRITDNSIHHIQYSDITENVYQFSHFLEYSGIDSIKPYLRPLSSMTEEEKNNLLQLMGRGTDIERIDFYISHHFDYRGLIPMGLALEAPEDMYKN